MRPILIGLVELQRVGTSAHFRAVPNARLVTSTFRNRGTGRAYRITAPFVVKTDQSAHHRRHRWKKLVITYSILGHTRGRRL